MICCRLVLVDFTLVNFIYFSLIVAGQEPVTVEEMYVKSSIEN